MKWDVIGPGDWRLLVEAGDTRESVLARVGVLLDEAGRPDDDRVDIEVGDSVRVLVSAGTGEPRTIVGRLLDTNSEGLTVRESSGLAWVPIERVVFVRCSR